MSAYELTVEQKARLVRAIRAVWAVPFIDDIEDFIWEAIFHYVKGFQIPDPLVEGRTKRLFDAVKADTHVGWSLKGLQWAIAKGQRFELVIQRADVLKKRKDLGFPNLKLDDPPSTIGAAVLEHWRRKVEADKRLQGVTDARVAILLKANDRRQYAYSEWDLHVYTVAEVNWSWTDETHQGLQAKLKTTGEVVLRWYPNQKQLFECFALDDRSYVFQVEPRRGDAARVLAALENELR